MEIEAPHPFKYLPFLIWGLVLFFLYLTSHYSYLLFHSLAEIFSVVIAVGVFAVAWNSRRFLQNNYFLFLGIAYLFVGLADLLHTLAYKGLQVFPGHGANLATQLWIIARYLESSSLLLAPGFIHRPLRPAREFLAYGAAFSLMLLCIFYWRIFPTCYVEGQGLTPFKIISEYVICLILLGALALLWQKHREFDPVVHRLIAWSILLAVGSELAFTFYVSVYGPSNFIGHLLKIMSFYLLYKALIETGLMEPYRLLFRDLKQSEEALRKERDFVDSLIETAPGVVLVLDPQGRIVRYNPRLEEISRYRLKEVQGQDWFKTFLPQDNPEGIRHDFLQPVAAVTSPGLVHAIITKDGEPRDIEWYKTPLRDMQNQLEGVLALGQDITERRRAEEEVRKLNAELELKIREVTQRRLELEAANRELESFSYSVSHDLRAPLRAISGFCRALEEEYAARLDSQAQDYMHKVQASTRQMAELIEALLSLSRTIRAEMHRQPVNLTRLARSMAENLQRSEPERLVEVVIGEDLVAEGDPRMLRAVLENLLGNAWKFTGKAARPRIEFGARPSPDGTPVFFVRDNGAGFNMKYASKLFGAFQRLHAARDFPGTGIGLATVQRIVQRHGGRVWAEGAEGEGATFYFTLAPGAPGSGG